MRAVTCFVLVLGLVATSCSSPTGTGSSDAATATTETPVVGREVTARQLASFARDLVADTGAEGGIVAWRVGDADPLVATAGIADARTGQGLHADDAFHVASITKSFVAATALVLDAEGVVDLDDRLSRYVDWPGGRQISLRQLLTHTSGVAGFPQGDADESVYNDLLQVEPPITLDQTMAAARRLPARSAPGTATEYGNLSYVLAGAAIEAATGQDLGTVFDERLFGPLGMDDTWYPPQVAGNAEPLPGIYEVEPGTPLLPTTAFDMEVWRTITAPAAGAVSTVDDLFAWIDAVLRDQELDGVELSAMSDIGAGGYGLGVAGVTEDGAVSSTAAHPARCSPASPSTGTSPVRPPGCSTTPGSTPPSSCT